jgi:hypothetical protein
MRTGTDVLLPGGDGIQGVLEYPLARGKLLIGLQGKPPACVEPTLRSLDRLLHLAPNWDSYGGRPIAHSSVWATLQLLTEILHDDTPPPAIVPTSRGGVQIE